MVEPLALRGHDRHYHLRHPQHGLMFKPDRQNEQLDGRDEGALPTRQRR